MLCYRIISIIDFHLWEFVRLWFQCSFISQMNFVLLLISSCIPNQCLVSNSNIFSPRDYSLTAVSRLNYLKFRAPSFSLTHWPPLHKSGGTFNAPPATSLWQCWILIISLSIFLSLQFADLQPIEESNKSGRGFPHDNFSTLHYQEAHLGRATTITISSSIYHVASHT